MAGRVTEAKRTKTCLHCNPVKPAAHLPHPFIIDLSSSCGNCLQNWPMTHPTTVSNEPIDWYSIVDCRYFIPFFPLTDSVSCCADSTFPWMPCKLEHSFNRLHYSIVYLARPTQHSTYYLQGRREHNISIWCYNEVASPDKFSNQSICRLRKYLHTFVYRRHQFAELEYCHLSTLALPLIVMRVATGGEWERGNGGVTGDG